MKHPLLANRQRQVIWWLVWLFMTLGQALLYYLATGSFVRISIGDSFLSMLIYSGIAFALWYPFNFFIINKIKSPALAFNLLISGALVITAGLFGEKMLMLLLVSDKDAYREFWNTTVLYRAGTGVFIFGLVILAYFLFVTLTNLSEKNAREARLESLVKETELKLLRSQINPHFLFNSLNSVSSLTITNPEKARSMVIKLSDFMRYALTRKEDRPVTLRSELESLRLYLDIEMVRFGDRLTIEEKINASCLNALIPVMILQPLYENAIKHGVYESIEMIKIITGVSCDNGYLTISITNNYEDGVVAPKGTGTGLRNVERRLELFYGNKASLVTTKEKGIFTVKLYIPYEDNQDGKDQNSNS